MTLLDSGKLRWHCVSAAMLLCLAGCWSKAAPEPIYIGHLAPRSGPDGDMGIGAARAILLAVEEANAADGQVAGRPVAVIHPDAAGDAEAVQTVAVRLLTIDRVPALLANVGTAQTERLSRAAQQYSVPLVAAAGLPNQGLTPNGFSVGLAPAEQGRTLARFLVQEKKVSSMALLVEDGNSLSAALAAAFVEETQKSGAKVWRRTFSGDKDFAPLAGDTVKEDVIAVVIAGTADAFRKLSGEMGKANIPDDVPLLFAGEEVAPHFLQGDAAPANSFYRVTAFVGDGGGTRAQEFAKKYQGRFEKPPEAAAALAYDAAHVLFEAMRRAKGFQGPKVRDELLKIGTFESLTGPLAFDKDQNARRPAFVVQIEKGREKLAKRYEPEIAPQ